MTDAEIFVRLQTILADILVLNPEDIHPSSRLADDLDADSIAFLELNHRLREDFGVDVPDPKVDEATLVLPLLDGLERIGSTAGSTLFDHLRSDVMAAAPDQHPAGVLAETVLDGLADPVFRDALLRSIRAATRFGGTAEAVAVLLRELGELPAVAARLESLETFEPEWQAAMEALRAAAPASSARADPQTLVNRWRNAFEDPHARLLLDRVTVDQFARMSGCERPADIPGSRRINGLRLKDLFRFVTVDSYVRYVRFLRASPPESQASPIGAL